MATPVVAVTRKVLPVLKKREQKNRRPRRIGTMTAVFMFATAFLFDAFQFFLTFSLVIGQVASIFIAFLAAVAFGIWFLILNVNYFTGRATSLKLISSMGSIAIEIIPFLQALPVITAGVIGIVVASRIEDSPERQAN